MSFTNNIRTITMNTAAELKKIDAEISKLEQEKGNYYQPKYEELMNDAHSRRASLISDGKQRVNAEVQTYKEAVKERFIPKGEELTADAALLNSGIRLTGADLESLIDKYSSNNTMKRLLHEYADRNEIEVNRKYYTEKDIGEAADILATFYDNVISRPEFESIWSSEEYFEGAVPEALAGE